MVCLEVPVDTNEKKILKLIYDSWENPNIRENSLKSYLDLVKINDKNSDYHTYFYKEVFKTKVDKLLKKLNFEINLSLGKKQVKLKKKDLIRIKNLESKIEELKDNIFEFIILKFLKNYINSGSRKEYYYYIIINLLRCTITNVNKYVLEVVKKIISSGNIQIKNIIKKSKKYIEKNKHVISIMI